MLVAITNALRDAPTLDTLGACMHAVTAQVVHNGVQSLVVPLLRVGRAITPESTLRATLGPIVDHLCAGSPLRQIALVLDEESELGLMLRLSRYLEATFDELVELGVLRAHAAALRLVEHRLQPLDLLNTDLLDRILRLQLDVHLALLKLLDRRQAIGGRDYDAVVAELQQCEHEVARLSAIPGVLERTPPLERAVGE